MIEPALLQELIVTLNKLPADDIVTMGNGLKNHHIGKLSLRRDGYGHEINLAPGDEPITVADLRDSLAFFAKHSDFRGLRDKKVDASYVRVRAAATGEEDHYILGLICTDKGVLLLRDEYRQHALACPVERRRGKKTGHIEYF